MRYDAYRRAGTAELGASGVFTDFYDETPNAWVIGVWLDGELGSAIRLHVSASPDAPLPILDAFGDEVLPLLESGRTVIDGSRFCTKFDLARRRPELPYMTLRASFMAGEYFDAEFLTVACLPEHQGFYCRQYGGVPWSGAKLYPGFRRPRVLVGYDRKAKAFIRDRYPFYESTPREREALFSRSSNAATDILSAIGRPTQVEATV